LNKKTLVLIIIALIICLSFSACNNDDSDVISGTITITFVTNVEQFYIDPIVLDGVTEVYMPDDPVKAGYTFGGWYYDENCTALFSVEDGLSEDITLYARWQKDTTFSEEETDPVYVESGGFVYYLEDSNYYISEYNGDDADIVIPITYNSKPIIGIDDNAFENNSIIETIKIQSPLQSIGESAFTNCTKLKSFVVTGSDYFSSDNGVLYNRDKTSILQIGMDTDLTVFEIGSDVEYIRKDAFYGCQIAVTFETGGSYNALEEGDFYGFDGSLTLNSSITSIGERGLNNFTGSLIFGSDNKITTIGIGAFSGYNGNCVVLPYLVNTISTQAFNGCEGTIDISMTNITTLGDNAFAEYKGETLEIPATVTSLGENVFYECSADITFAEGCTITTIPYYAFGRFAGTVHLPSSVTTLENYAFAYAQSIAEIYFGTSESQITTIGENVFYNCNAIVSYSN
jgi:uncharacterized repeat protein (TIGR02543 family)